jgi:hypothetical protein
MTEAHSLQHVSGAHGVLRKEASHSIASAEDWAQVWFNLVRHEWTSLAFVPADRRASALNVVRALAEAARPYQCGPVGVIDAERIVPSDVPSVINAIRESAVAGTRLLVAVGSPLAHQAAVPVGRSADACVLVVRLGVSETKQARRTIERIGGEHFFGSLSI